MKRCYINSKVLFFALGFISLSMLFCPKIILHSFAADLESMKVCFLSGDYKAAIQEGEKLIAQGNLGQEGLDQVYYILALSYLKDENYLRASDIFEIIIDEFKNSPLEQEAKMGLADSYFLRQDFDMAEGYYKGLLKDKPKDSLLPMIYHRLSQCAFKTGNKQEAKEYLEKLKNSFPASPEANIDKNLPTPYAYYAVQAGSFSNKRNAKNLTDKLAQQGYSAYLEEANYKGKISYRVRVGKLNSRREAEELEKKLIEQGYPARIFP